MCATRKEIELASLDYKHNNNTISVSLWIYVLQLWSQYFKTNIPFFFLHWGWHTAFVVIPSSELPQVWFKPIIRGSISAKSNCQPTLSWLLQEFVWASKSLALIKLQGRKNAAENAKWIWKNSRLFFCFSKLSVTKRQGSAAEDILEIFFHRRKTRCENILLLWWKLTMRIEGAMSRWIPLKENVESI